MAVALPYIFYTAVAAGTYVSVTSAQKAARDASAIGDMNAQAALQQGEANAQAYEAQGESEARVAEKQASATLLQAQAEALATRRQNERVRGTQRVSFLKSGITISGTAQDVIYDSAIEGELEALNTEYRGRTGYNYYTDEAALTRNSARSNAYLSRIGAKNQAASAAYEGGARARAYRAQSVGSFFQGAAMVAGGPSFT